MNVSYGMKRMYVKGRVFLYTMSYHGKEVGNVDIYSATNYKSV